MASQPGRPLPKFGEWDVNNPASAEGFTVIFSKARDEKKNPAPNAVSPRKKNADNHQQRRQDEAQMGEKPRWFCCG